MNTVLLRGDLKGRIVDALTLGRKASLDDQSPTHERILRQEQARLFGDVVGARVLILPVVAAALLSLAWFEPFGWQAALLIGLSASAPAFFVVEYRRYRVHGLEPRAIPRNLLVSAFGQLAVCSATGGLLSPFIYGVLPIAGVSGAFLGRTARTAVAVLQLSALTAFTVLGAESNLLPMSSALGGGAHLPAAHYYAHGALLAILSLVSGQVGHVLGAVFSKTLQRAMSTQRDLLTSHRERVSELTTLSAEIAHELKNPLASIKGLAGLLAQNVADDRGKERLQVLRREVDRMQGVLEEFLNFSRPLVPLSLVSCDLHELGAEVVRLHEGLARERNVTFTLEGESTAISCDPRKVKQILINLVQNAIDASPPSGVVRLSTQSSSGQATVRIEDDGPGPDPELGDWFQPGITSKSGGTGLGLTIARSLALQHGGNLELCQRDPHGCVAKLVLPNRPVATLPST